MVIHRIISVTSGVRVTTSTQRATFGMEQLSSEEMNATQGQSF